MFPFRKSDDLLYRSLLQRKRLFASQLDQATAQLPRRRIFLYGCRYEAEYQVIPHNKSKVGKTAGRGNVVGTFQLIILSSVI